MNRDRRLLILMTALLLSLGWLLYTYLQPFETSSRHTVLPGTNEISAVRLLEIDPYRAKLEFEYFFNGESGPTARIEAEAPMDEPAAPASPLSFKSVDIVKPGKNKIVISVPRSSIPPFKKYQTKVVKAALQSHSGERIVEKNFDYVINWPSNDPFVLNSNDPKEVERIYNLCVAEIDGGNPGENVKRGLEQVLLVDPNYVPAYPELARYLMRHNWSREGLRQAEQALNTAIRIDPKHANSFVLLGYVYAHQGRLKEAEQALRTAETIGTPNIWLYTNLGELQSMQGRKEQAIAAYKKAIDAPEDLKTYERAREDAYRRLLLIFIADKKWQETETLHAQRVSKFPNHACFKADYADFRLRKIGDYDNAIIIGNQAFDQGCKDEARQVLSMAYYTKWAAALKAGTEARDADQYFNRGQALYSHAPSLLYSLAGSEHTVKVISELKRRGFQIDMPDKDGLTALSLSIINADIEAAQALIRQGANVNQALNEEGVTLLMLAANRGDGRSVSLLLKNGANRKAKTRHGYTAEMFAKERGFNEIVNLLAGRPGI